MTEKIKIFTISDHPLSPSGVGTQTKYIIESMLKTGKYQFVSFGGAVKHNNQQPQKTEEWGLDWIIFPVDGYGDPDKVRSLIHQQKPDILWFMTDPRFYGWLWEMENEIRAHIPMIYYHVWDNYPYPKFNRASYLSNDHIACISKVTYDIVQTVAPEVASSYIPHAVDEEIFKPSNKQDIQKYKSDRGLTNKFVCFWNNRNARRKQSGTVIWWFKDFLDKVGHDKACLIMHTEVHDQHGQDLEAIIHELGLTNGQVLFSRNKVEPKDLAAVYNMADLTINIADAEGFGLGTLESLSCGTPILVNMTGGLQEQVTDGENWFGRGLQPASRAIIGSQQVPFIYEDRVSREDFLQALTELYEMGPEAREELGQLGRAWTQEKYNFGDFVQKWDDLFTETHNNCGSWESRENYAPYEVRVH
tara:strand:+ start:1024 stop:2274 length:1251 start_codon:yes stop_codon:yes gene_type:complete